MRFLKKLASIFIGGSGGSNGRALSLYVLCNRCHEPISAEVDLMNSLSREEDSDAQFYTRKVLQGSGQNRCFTQVEVELWFDRNKKVIRHEVSGGRWLTADEYETELARFNAPPQEDKGPESDSLSSC